MNFSHYFNMANKERALKFTFVKDNRPFVEYQSADSEALSEVALYSEDLEEIKKEILSLSEGAPVNDRGVFYFSGNKYSYNFLDLQDSSAIEVHFVNQEKLEWKDFLAPGYLNDWLEAKKGILVFYANQNEALDLFRKEFLSKRASLTLGKSLIFSSRMSEEALMSHNEEHFVLASKNEKLFFEEKSASMFFNYYSFERELEDLPLSSVLKLSDKGSLVSIISEWSSLEQVWLQLQALLSSNLQKNFFSELILGFVGLKLVESKSGGKDFVFELLPFTEKETLLELSPKEQKEKITKLLRVKGISFNQSLHSLILKRRVKLDVAYEASPDPEDLNKMLAASGV